MPVDTRLYWPGNAAKTYTIGRILRELREDRATLIFDYGCGNGGDWPRILADHPQVHLIGHDPARESLAAARRRLSGCNAHLLDTAALARADFSAQYIVSFSVLEHVYRVDQYLATAKKHLAPDGVFYLNYDDGHFRNVVDLNTTQGWRAELLHWFIHKTATPRGWLGRLGNYQRRVDRATLDRKLTAVGFRADDVFYSNLACMKQLYKTIPEDRREAFSELWLRLERDLNLDFRHLVLPQRGDDVNLWQVMASRTVVLRHAAHA